MKDTKKERVLKKILRRMGLRLTKTREAVDGQILNWKISPNLETEDDDVINILDAAGEAVSWCKSIRCSSLDEVEECILKRVRFVYLGKVENRYFKHGSLEEVEVSRDLEGK